MSSEVLAVAALWIAACDPHGSGLSALDDGGLLDAASPGDAQGDGETMRDGAVGHGADAGTDARPASASYKWDLPPGFSEPVVPTDNPMSEAKVALGRHLFYDTRLSGNQTQSCASCHKQELAFTDGRARALGSTGIMHPRSSMSLANVAYASTLTWANPLELDLEHQALVPMFGDDPIELGLSSQSALVDRLKEVDTYQELFAAAYPDDPDPISLTHIVQGLASFERTLISGRSPFDRYLYDGDQTAIDDAAKRGYELFNSEKFECFHCHVGFNLSDHVNWRGKAFFDKPYHNTGLYNLDGKGAYPEPNTGVFHVTMEASDMGKFKAPTLRNVGVTAPYMHDGSIATLEQVLDHYQAGGRTLASGPYAGDGAASPLKDPLIRPLTITTRDREDVIAFLRSLTDAQFMADPRFGDPWPSRSPKIR